MLSNKTILMVVLGVTFVAGGTHAADKASAEAAIAAAKAARAAAAEVGGEWRDTGKIISAAEKAAAAGNFADAEKLAGKAEDQGMLGKEQAMSQTSVGNPKYLYN